MRRSGIYEKYIKRILDVIFSMCVLLLFWWLLLIVAFLVRVKLGSPVLFKQPRPGKNEEVFTLLKFRTMTDERGPEGDLLPDADRLTSFVRWLRSTSLDELPEVLNILKGDLSFIGPRPLLVEYLPYYREDEKRRHSVRPGLTGLAQVCGRNHLDWDSRLAKDVEYVDNISFAMDLKILFKTFSVVFKKSGVAVDSDSIEGNLATIRAEET